MKVDYDIESYWEDQQGIRYRKVYRTIRTLKAAVRKIHNHRFISAINWNTHTLIYPRDL